MKIHHLALGVLGTAALVSSGMLLWQQRRVAQACSEIERLRADNAALPALREELNRLRPVQVDLAELNRLREQANITRVELMRLRARATDASQAEAEAARMRTELEHRASEGSAANQPVAAPIAEMMRDATEQMSRRQVGRMQERLNLTAAQTQAIQKILSRKAAVMAEAAKGVFAGKLDREKLASFRRDKADSESEIQALLSPEQQAEYVAFKEEERLKQAFTSANGQLVEMHRILELREDQNASVFNALHEVALEQVRAEADGPEPGNPAEAEERAMNRKLQALQAVLTPAQLASYRQHEEMHLAYLKRLAGQLGERDATR